MLCRLFGGLTIEFCAFQLLGPFSLLASGHVFLDTFSAIQLLDPFSLLASGHVFLDTVFSGGFLFGHCRKTGRNSEVGC